MTQMGTVMVPRNFTADARRRALVAAKLLATRRQTWQPSAIGKSTNQKSPVAVDRLGFGQPGRAGGFFVCPRHIEILAGLGIYGRELRRHDSLLRLFL